MNCMELMSIYLQVLIEFSAMDMISGYSVL